VKVLQIVPELNAGGVERTTLEIAEALYANGHIPHICSAGGRMVPKFKPFEAVHHTLNVGSKNPIWLRRHTRKLIDIIKTEQIDLVHARSRAPAWPGRAAAKATGKPFITTYHGIYNARSSAKRRYNAIMTKGDLIIANSMYTKDHIVAEHGTDPKKIRVIPRGVDMTLFDPDAVSPGDIKSLKSKWQIVENDKVVLLPGRLTSWKGQIIAIKALSNLPPNFKLVLLGDSQGRHDYVTELFELAKQCDMEQRLIIPGHTEDVATALAAADIVIAPSTDPEAFGRVVIEAQAMAKPVIASAHGGPMETILPEKTGLLIAPQSPEALSDAIQTVLSWDNYDGAAARQHIADRFSKTQLQSKTLKTYTELLV